MHTVVNIYSMYVYLYVNKEEANIIPRERLKNIFFFVFPKCRFYAFCSDLSLLSFI